MKRRGIRVSRSFSRTICTFLIFACLLFPNAALGFSTAVISGRVTDFNNAVIPGARVDANNIDTNVTSSTVTNSEGLFVIPNLPPGRYRIFVHKEGFQTVVKPDVVLHVQDVLSLSFSMQLGSISQSVTIEGGSPLIQKESATVGTVVDRQFVENLPLNGRSFQSLITLAPGAVLTKTRIDEQGQFSINGQRANSNYFMIDGVSANIGVSPGTNAGQATAGTVPGLSASGGTNNLVSIDALQEFKIQTSTFAPEFGRTPGAQVSIVTRSGTNDLRGTLFEYFRNDALDANDWLANQKGLRKPALRQNDFGGVFGGPIRLPKAIFGPLGYDGQSRTFFFFSYEGLRLRLPQTGVTAVPSLSARTTASLGIQQYLKAFPIPNGKDLSGNFSEFNATFSDPSSLDATSIRIDHTINNRLTAFVRYNYSPSETRRRGGNFSLSTLTFNPFITKTLTGGATILFSPEVSNDLRLNHSSNSGTSLISIDNFGGAFPLTDSILFPNSMSSRDSFFRLNLGGAGSAGLQQGLFSFNLQRQINIVDTLSVSRGRHQLKIGGDYRKLYPIFDFARYGLNININGVNAALEGKASSATISAFIGKQYPLFTNLSLFAQDTMRFSRRLTLTFGTRWEFNPPPSEKHGNDPLAVINLDNPTKLSLAARGTPIYKTRYDSFAPRIGIAYQLSQEKGREIVIRSGFGIFYDLGTGPAASAFGIGFPNMISRDVPGSFTANGVPFPLDPVSATPPSFNLNPPYGNLRGVIDPNFKMPFSYQWNLSVERSFGANQTLSGSYVAAVGRRLPRQELLRNPNPIFQTLYVTRSIATSDYHALQLQFQRRLSRGFQLYSSYSWAHSIDNTSTDSSFEAPANNIDLSQERGPSDFDVRQSFNAAATYDLPSLLKNKFVHTLLRDFSIDAIFRTRSSTPVNIITGMAAVGGFSGVSSVSRPDVISGVPLYVEDPTVVKGKKINRAAFTVPSGRQGTLSRNALRGFSMWQADVALRRKFSLTEKVELQLRIEAFNVFNHPNFGDPGAGSTGTNVLTNPQFGQSINMLGRSLGSGGSGGGLNPLYQVGGPRSMQLALKILF